MAFFQQLIADLEHSPPKRDAQPLGGASRRNAGSAAITQHTIDVPKEVLKFAPKKVRRQQTAEDPGQPQLSALRVSAPTNCRRGRTGNVEHVELADQIVEDGCAGARHLVRRLSWRSWCL